MAERLERWTCNSEAPIEFKSRPDLAEFVHGSPEFKSLTTLVNSCSWFASG